MAIWWLAVLAILVPVAGALLIGFGGRRWRVLREPVALLATFVNLLLVAAICSWVIGAEPEYAIVAGAGTFWALYVDALSALMMALVAVLSFLVVVYSTCHMEGLVKAGKIADERLPLFYALVLLFAASMLWACATDNIIVLYLAVEATTLASGLLVTFYWNKRALEAGYKYLLLLTVGISFALFGCVLIYGALASYVPGGHWNAMMLSQIRQSVSIIAQHARGMLVLAMAFLVIGFGTKAGVIPFHPWLPDAHAEAPSPVSVLLSGIVIKVGAYALIRTTVPFLAVLPALQIVLVLLGVATMLVGIALVAAQDDLKRLLAYSSVSQIGYIVLAMGIGTALGAFGAVYHIINHALAKSALFLGAGAVEQSTGTRAISKLGGLARTMPVTAACFIAGCLALGGAPGLNGFMSKLTICLAAMRAGLWWAGVLAALTGVFTLVVLVRAATAVFWGSGDVQAVPEAREVPAAMWVVMLILVLLCVALGAWPPWVVPALSQASAALAPVAPATSTALGFLH